MRRPRLSILLLGLAALPLAPADAPAEQGRVAWNLALNVDASTMNGAQRTRATQILRREFCYYGCSRRIADCLAEDPPSRTARRLAGFVVREVLADRTDEEIAQDIQNRALSAHPVELATIDLTGVECVGDQNAAVTIVEYADFQCPFCRVISPALHALVGQLQPDVRLCFKHFPVRGHEHALPAAIAALAAGRQGRFWQMHDALYDSAPRLEDRDIEAAATAAGVPDIARWRRERNDAALRRVVEEHKLEGLRNGARGTPAIFVNRKLYLGRNLEVEIRDRVEEELDLARGQR